MNLFFEFMKTIFSLFLLLISSVSFAQTALITGVVKDKLSKEPIPGATVSIANKKVVSDFDGNYSISDVPYGTYKIQFAAVEMDTVEFSIKVNSATIIQNIELGGGTEFEEIKVIANINTDRITPIPLTRITAEKIAEELGSRDLPMILNATPGVYATQTGGGDGDARISVRGFDQRNIGVMIDGVPVNDMENGAVYWSNWFGLDAITNQIQVQRGLGATKLSMPSVGGSMNILTNGIGNRKGGTIKQEFVTGNFIRTSVTYNTGLMKNGFGVTGSLSYKQGDGWVDGTPTQGKFYYVKVQKKTKNHLISFSAFGAPQKHGQRSFYQPIQYWDTTYAKELGATLSYSGFLNKGIRYNQHWGYINRGGSREILNERENFYHKPQLTLKDFWTVNKKLSISNIAYMSIGRGGGTRAANTGALLYDSLGRIDWDNIVLNNQVDQLFGGPAIDPAYSMTELKATQVLVASYNNHFWVGYLPQFSYEASKELKIAGGLDYRFYKGEHYQEIHDILGGDYYINTANKNNANPMQRLGDKIALNTFNNHRDGLVQWGGVFGSVEYATSRWSGFLNLSGVINAYKGVDYFEKKQLVLSDTTLRIGANDTIVYNGQTYTAASEGLEYYQTDWKTIPGGTIKLGGSYILNENSNIYVNLGYLSRTPLFNNVVDNNTNTFFQAIENEVIQAVELGYSFSGKKFGMNINGYYTNWINKPFPFGVSVPDPSDPTNTIQVNINGMDAIHMGAEIDMAYEFNKKLSAEFMFSLGNWTWNSADTFRLEEFNLNYGFDAKGVHVGDAAQTMLNASIRYAAFKNFYIKAQYQWFDRYYANFSPFALQGENAGREAWQIPSYGLLNAFIGYSRKFEPFGVFINASVTNILGTEYIADANDNATTGPDTFDATSANVMFGMGRRFNLTVGINF